MAKNEIEAEFNEPQEIVFRKICIYCQEPATKEFHLKEQSKIENILSRPLLSLFFLFLIFMGLFTAIINVFMPDRSAVFPALFLAVLSWQIISVSIRNKFKNLFRHANVYVCDSCFTMWSKGDKIQTAYWSVISVGFLILAILSFVYNESDLKQNGFTTFIFATSLLGALFGSVIIGFLKGLMGSKLEKTPIQLNKQGIIKGTTKLTMLEDDFNKFVVEDE